MKNLSLFHIHSWKKSKSLKENMILLNENGGEVLQ